MLIIKKMFVDPDITSVMRLMEEDTKQTNKKIEIVTIYLETG